MGRAVIDVSLIFLEDLLRTQETPFQYKISGGLPEDACLLKAQVTEEHVIRLTFESEFIEDKPVGTNPPVIEPKFERIVKPYNWQSEVSVR